MSDPIGIALFIVGLPLAAAIIAAAFCRGSLRTAANWPLIAACATAAVLALVLLALVAEASGHQFLSEPVTWFAAGRLKVNFTINIDPLSAIMLAMITFVSTWIAIFSTGYMKGDRGYARFFAVMSLFVFSMCGLVLANNFLLLVAFWEGVGLCSYLLVGYYFEKPSAAAAARKAFLVTRIGDTGFILGIFLLWRMGGWHTDLTALFDTIAKNPPDQASLTTACLLLFCGAVGKSAQFPLYVWLPDAMEGPTPVSALIHAATMVTAGVYLLARCAPLFARCPEATLIVAWIGGITALLAAFIALAQTDLKRILAYSTVSQLGFMFLALGTMGVVSPVFAVTAAMFHLFTHAFFKALLFLSAGSVMHAMGGVIDVRQFGGLRKLMPVTHVTFLCGAAALAGIPLLSGYWSKDLILESLKEAGDGGGRYAGSYLALLVIALLTAFLTAFYTFRAYCLTFWGKLRVPPEAGHHAHESPSVMTVPLIVLAVGALIIGAVLEPFTHWFSGFLGKTPSLALAAAITGIGETPHHFNWTIAIASACLALAGTVLACVLYRRGTETVPASLEPIHTLSRNKLYVEDLYEAVVVRPACTLAFLAKAFDGSLDGLARFASALPRFLGALARPIQNGLVQFYALSMALGVVVLLSFVVFRGHTLTVLLRAKVSRMIATISFLVFLLVALPLAAAVIVPLFGRVARRVSLWFAILHLGLTTAVMIPAIGVLKDRDYTNLGVPESQWMPIRPVFVPGHHEHSGHRSTWTLLSLSATPPSPFRAGPNIQLYLGLDGINVWLAALASIMMIPAILVSWESIKDRPGSYFGWLFLLQGGAIGAFLSFDVILFYVFFELTLIPAFFLIGHWGLGSARRDAARKFFLYTLAGSFLTLIGLVGIVLTNPNPDGSITFSLPDLIVNVHIGLNHAFRDSLGGRPDALAAMHRTQFWLFLALMAGFMVKVPVWPFHTWLPSAYAESPTGVTILLSALLAKLGTFGIIRFVLPLTPDAAMLYGLPVVGTLAAFGIVYASLCAYDQKDIKLIIAYSSVSHLGFLVLGIFAFNAEGLSGAALHMVNHGLSTGALFALLAFLLDRYGTTQVSRYGGLMRRYPRFAVLAFVLSLASVGLPGLNNFVSEMLMLAGLYDTGNPRIHHLGLAVVAAIGILLSAWYMLTMMQRVFFNPMKEPVVSAAADVSGREFAAFGSLAGLCLLLGLYPQLILDTVKWDVQQLSTIGTMARERVTGTIGPLGPPPQLPVRVRDAKE